jgi:hypothetical protein
MKPNYKPPFNSFVKKQHKPLQLAIEDAVEDVCATPEAGEPKVGDLQGIWVHKFKHQGRQYLIAYRPPSDDELKADGVDIELLFIDFYQVGTHENFYADLKNYLKS